MNKVLILMSTYNGESYIEEQLLSLKLQTCSCDILIRDDGSSDNTKLIVEKFINNNKEMNISFYVEENIGCCNSFMNLLKKSKEYEYYMFCDQDDIWEPFKVEYALELVKNKPNDKSVLYFSNMTLISENGDILKEVEVDPFLYNLNEKNTLVRSYAYGCTMLFNNFTKQKYIKFDSRILRSHDWFMTIVASLFGEIVYDDRSTIRYRQHQNNVVGYNKKRTFKKSIKNLKNNVCYRSYICKKINEVYNDCLNNDVVNIISNYKFNILRQAKIIKNGYLICDSKKNEMKLIVFLLLNLL